MSTTKNFSRSVAFVTQTDRYAGCPKVHSGPFKTTVNRTLSSSVTYGDNISDWREKIASGKSATTSLTGTSTLNYHSTAGGVEIWTFDCGPLLLLQRTTGDILGYQFSPNPASTSVDLVADQNASSKFLSNYIKATNTWRGGNFVAEVRETIHMLRHPVQSFYRSTWEFAGRVKKLGKIYRKSKRSYAEHLGDAWLAWAFGVKPLIADCNDAMDALNKVKTGTGHDQTIIKGFGRRLSNSQSDPTWSINTPSSTGTGSSIKYRRNDNVSFTVRYYGSMNAALTDRETVGQQFGVGIYDVVPAVWEAIPWSFFIDYFANVGEMIDSCRLWSADFGWCNRTVRNSSATTFSDLRVVTPPASGTYAVTGSPRFYALSRYVLRTASGVPSPSFHFKMPGIDSMKWLNIFALSTQIKGSKP